MLTKTLSRTPVYDWHYKISGAREFVQNETHARRPRTSNREKNIFAICEMIEGDRRLTIWEIAAHVGISYGSAQELPKSVGKVSCSPLYGRSENKPFCRVRKTRHDTEQRTMISRGTLSSVTRRRCIITFRSLCRQVWSGENLEKQHCGKSKLIFQLEKILQRSFGIAEAHCSLIFSMKCVKLMLRTTANCLMK